MARTLPRLFVLGVGRLTGTAIRNQQHTGSSRKPVRLRVLDRLVSPRISRLAGPEPAAHKKVAKVLAETTYWHGTGRYQHHGGKVVDVLAHICAQGALAPGPDPFETLGHMHSISLARARIYARAYGDLHRDPTIHAERHGSSSFWATVFLGDYTLEAAREEGGLRRVVQRLEAAGKDDWHGKINRRPLSVFGSFLFGSDIPGNYPIIFGIHTASALPASRAIAIHEIRSGEPISLARQVTYVEVPQANIAETEQLLRGCGVAIPVHAMEDFEHYAATLPLSQLVRGS